MVIRITKRFLWFPARRGNREVKLHFYTEGRKFQELDIGFESSEPDLFFAMDVGEYIGREIEIRSDSEDGALERVACNEEKPHVDYPFRPRLHFTAEAGWINDPNGLIYADGWYHLYHQWNPYGTGWGNMHWGHAVSRDMVAWEKRPVALVPDEFGTVFSGCGWQDVGNTAGFGDNSLLFFIRLPEGAADGRQIRGIDSRRGSQYRRTAEKRLRRRGRSFPI